MNYAELAKALVLFGLGERASLQQIKSRQRSLVKAHHPDRRGNDDAAFSEKEFLEQNPEERLRRQFDCAPE